VAAFNYDWQIASQPDAVDEIITRSEAIGLDPDRPIVLTGVGTFLHVCKVARHWFAALSGGSVDVSVADSHYLALHGRFRPEQQIVIVTDHSIQRFPAAVLERARAAGAYTTVVTGFSGSDPDADSVLHTCTQDPVGTHTVAYLSAMTTMALVVSDTLGEAASSFRKELNGIPDKLREAVSDSVSAEIAVRIAWRSPILVVGFGIDTVTAHEAALKIKQGTYIWSEGMSIEAALQGPPAAFNREMAVLTYMPGVDDGGRSAELITAARSIGTDVITLGVQRAADICFPDSGELLRPMLGIVPIQLLVSALAQRNGSNPDSIHSDEEPWRSAIASLRF
jgi:glucosamine--fructose-6-phosphate aminotransferase (isomerizing)